MRPFSVLSASCLVAWLVIGPLHGLSPAASAAVSPPWDLAALSKPPAFEWLTTEGPVRSLTYAGGAFQGKPTKVFAYHASPETLGTPDSAGKKHPGIVLIHGGGGTAFRVWTELWAKRGYAAIAMDLGGMRPDETDPKIRTRLPEGGPDQSHVGKFDTIRTEDPTDDWSQHAVTNAILAHSLLRSFKEVDPTHTAVTGISWGGYTTCIVASVDTRFQAAVPVYGCGFLWENSSWLPEFEKLGPDLTRRWSALYDPSVYLKDCKVPVFFVNGTNDVHYRLDSYMKSFESVTHAPKSIRIQVKMPHGHESGWAPKEIGLWIDEKLGVRDEKPLPACTLPTLQDGKASARVTFNVPIKTATFSYALPGEQVHTREWRTVPATVENGVVTAAAPEDGSDMWFFNVTDERDAMVSSPVAFRK